jgi:hypothetical protein
MNNNFNEVMSRKSDSQLTAILTSEREQFQPDALAAAEHELKKRNLTVENVKTLTIENAIKSQEEIERAEEPLEPLWKVLAFFIPGLIPLIFSASFKADGYHRKAKGLLKWTGYGFVFYIVFITIVQILGI